MNRRPILVVAIAALVLAVAPTAFAGKGGNGRGKSGTSSLRLVMVTDVDGNGVPNWGDTVTFDVSTTATTQPNLELVCSQNGTVVYGATTGFYDGYPWPWTRLMTLGSTAWSGGAANCSARLYAFSGSRMITLTTLSFTAGA
jgi:hypothetical protein